MGVHKKQDMTEHFFNYISSKLSTQSLVFFETFSFKDSVGKTAIFLNINPIPS